MELVSSSSDIGIIFYGDYHIAKLASFFQLNLDGACGDKVTKRGMVAVIRNEAGGLIAGQ